MNRSIALKAGLLAWSVIVTGCTQMPGDPVLSVSVNALTFEGSENGLNPDVQSITIRNAGGDTLAWTASSNADWISLAPASGMTMDETAMTVTVDTAMLTMAASPYSATITVSSANASNTDETVDVSLTITPGMCTELSGTLGESMTLSGCVNVTSSVTVRDSGVTLTIAPGTRLNFAANTGLFINDEGRLAASGTAEDPILMTGMEATPGSWVGVNFLRTNSTTNRLDYVTIEYAGSDDLANLVVDGSGAAPSRVAVTHSTFSDGAAYGFYWDADVLIDEFTDNTMTNNAMGAGNVVPESIGALDDGSSYSGNDIDVLNVRDGTVTTAQTWSAINVPYRVSSNITVTGDLIIDAGAELIYNQGSTLTIRDDGSLTANGTAAAPILMTGADATRGYWNGINFLRSNSVSNILSYVTVEYAGSGLLGNLTVDGTSAAPSRIRVDNCTFREGANYGFYWDVDVIIDQFSSVTSTANDLGPGSCVAESAGFIEDSATFVGNDIDRMEIRGGSVATDQTWARLDVPYFMDALTTVGAALAFDAGLEIIFGQGVGLNVQDDGSLSAIGTAAAPILLTGDDPTSGYWAGVQFLRSNSESNRIEYVTIEYGGGVYDGNLDIDGTSSSISRIDVSNSTFRNSGSYGIYIDTDATVNGDIETVNTFSGNTDGTVRFP